MKIKSLLNIFFVLFSIVSCSTGRDFQLTKEDEISRYRIIYFIQGDGSYLYHDSTGKGINADENVLKQAFEVATSTQNAEVFIFHKRPERNLLFLFQFNNFYKYHFRNGKLLNKESSLVDNEKAAFKSAFRFIKDINQKSNQPPKFFLYYGHNISEWTEDKRLFSISSLVNFFSKDKDSYPYDLIVLSTCNNGTPFTIKELSPYSKFILASPSDLHLSHINSLFLKALNSNPTFNLKSFVQGFTENAFNRLAKQTFTATTLSLYDIEKLKPFLTKVELNNISSDNIVEDCKELHPDLFPVKDGVKVYYNPSKFGKDKNKLNHSGWGCNGTPKSMVNNN